MKRILIIGMTDLLGGVETYIYSVIKNIDRRKYSFDFLIIGQGIKAVYEREINELIGDGLNHFFYSPNLKRHYFMSSKWLKQFYDSHNYDAIYLNTTTAARIMYCRYALNNKESKLIAHSHQGNAVSLKKSMGNRLFKHYLTKRSWKKLACSEIAYKWLFDDIPLPGCIIPNGIETDKFRFNDLKRKEIRGNLGIADNKIVIGHVGRWSTQKNQSFFISLSQLLGDDYLFLCIGDGPDKETFELSIKEKGVSDRFVILGARNDVNNYYSAMDIFAMPSYYEGLPIVAVEAQCNGLPCVFSDSISKHTDISGRCFFVSINQQDKWRAAIECINKERYDGEACLKDRGFSIFNTVKILDSILESI